MKFSKALTITIYSTSSTRNSQRVLGNEDIFEKYGLPSGRGFSNKIILWDSQRIVDGEMKYFNLKGDKCIFFSFESEK